MSRKVWAISRTMILLAQIPVLWAATSLTGHAWFAYVMVPLIVALVIFINVTTWWRR